MWPFGKKQGPYREPSPTEPAPSINATIVEKEEARLAKLRAEVWRAVERFCTKNGRGRAAPPAVRAVRGGRRMTDRDEMDVEYERVMAMIRTAMQPMINTLHKLPNGAAAVREVIDAMKKEATEKVCQSLMHDKMTEDHRQHMVRLLARMPADIEAMVKPPNPDARLLDALKTLYRAAQAHARVASDEEWDGISAAYALLHRHIAGAR